MKTGAWAVCVSHQYVRHATVRLNSSVAVQNVEHKEERPNFDLSWGLPRWSIFLSICKTANPPIAIVHGGRLHLSSRRVCYPLRLLMSLLPKCIGDGRAGWIYIRFSMSAQTIFKVWILCDLRREVIQPPVCDRQLRHQPCEVDKLSKLY